MASSVLKEAWVAYKLEDYVTARRLFAEDDSKEAIFNLGQMMLNGEGGEADVSTARECFEQCDGDAYASTALGEIWHTAGDFARARQYFESAVEQGDAAAMTMLGQMQYDGEGGEVDKTEARRLFGVASRDEDSEASSLLAKMLLRGEGGFCPPSSMDLAEARQLYEKLAVEEGDAVAQRNFAIMCFNGDGGLKDVKTAHQYIQLAASQGDEFAKSKVNVIEGSLIQDALRQSGLMTGPKVSYEETLD